MRARFPVRAVRRGRGVDQLRQVQALPRAQAAPGRGHARLPVRAQGDRDRGQRGDRGPGRAGRGEALFPDLALAWADGEYAIVVDDSIIASSRGNPSRRGRAGQAHRQREGVQDPAPPLGHRADQQRLRISAHRRLARDCETQRLVECSEAMTDLAMIDVMAAPPSRQAAWATLAGPGDRGRQRYLTQGDQLLTQHFPRRARAWRPSRVSSTTGLKARRTSGQNGT